MTSKLEELAKWHEGQAAEYRGINIARLVAFVEHHTDAAQTIRDTMALLVEIATGRTHPRTHRRSLI